MATRKSNQKKDRERYHHGALRRDLLRVAREEISRSGAQAVSLASLARLAGVSQPAPYRHFADRDAVFEALAAEGFEELAVTLTEAAAKHAPENALRAISLAYLAYGEANIELYRLMFASRLVPEAEPGSALDIASDKAFERLRDTVSATSTGTVVEEEAYSVWAQLHGLVMLKADDFIRRPLYEYLLAANTVESEQFRQ